MSSTKPSIKADYFLDITALDCPMTFVKTKLMLERMAPGETCAIRLQGVEPLLNVPRSATELGHEIISLTPEDETKKKPNHGTHNLIILKK